MNMFTNCSISGCTSTLSYQRCCHRPLPVISVLSATSCRKSRQLLLPHKPYVVHCASAQVARDSGTWFQDANGSLCRLAHRVAELENLPYGLSAKTHILKASPSHVLPVWHWFGISLAVSPCCCCAEGVVPVIVKRGLPGAPQVDLQYCFLRQQQSQQQR